MDIEEDENEYGFCRNCGLPLSEDDEEAGSHIECEDIDEENYII